MKHVILILFRFQAWGLVIFFSLGSLVFFGSGEIVPGIGVLLLSLAAIWRLSPYLFRGVVPVLKWDTKTIFTYFRWNFGVSCAMLGSEGFMTTTKQHERPVFLIVYLLIGLILISPLDRFIFTRYRSIIPALSVRPKDSTEVIVSGIWWFVGLTIYFTSAVFFHDKDDLTAGILVAIGLAMIFINPMAAALKDRKPTGPVFVSYPWKNWVDALGKVSTEKKPFAATAIPVTPIVTVTSVTTARPAATVKLPVVEPDVADVKQNEYLQLIQKGESSIVEFKSTLRVDVRTGKPEKFIQHSVIKTLAAFLNSQGGTLLIGVEDNKNIMGLEKDFSSFSKDDKLDEFQKYLDNLLGNSIGNRFHRYLQVEFPEIDSKVICVIRIRTKSSEPVYIVNDAGQEIFYIRRLASTIDLKPSEAFKYMQEHW